MSPEVIAALALTFGTPAPATADPFTPANAAARKCDAACLYGARCTCGPTCACIPFAPKPGDVKPSDQDGNPWTWERGPDGAYGWYRYCCPPTPAAPPPGYGYQAPVLFGYPESAFRGGRLRGGFSAGGCSSGG